MRKFALLLILSSGTLALASVSVSTPANGSTVSTTVRYVASASSSCSKGVSAMGIYTAPYQLAYTTPGAKLDTALTLNPGVYNTVVEEWDNCGGASVIPITITVGSGGSGGSGQVTVTTPKTNSTVASTVPYEASATSPCSKGVSAMGIYTASGQLAYTTPGAQLNTTLTLNAGVYDTVVEEWDNCGGAATTPITITVGGGTPMTVPVSVPGQPQVHAFPGQVSGRVVFQAKNRFDTVRVDLGELEMFEIPRFDLAGLAGALPRVPVPAMDSFNSDVLAPALKAVPTIDMPRVPRLPAMATADLPRKLRDMVLPDADLSGALRLPRIADIARLPDFGALAGVPLRAMADSLIDAAAAAAEVQRPGI